MSELLEIKTFGGLRIQCNGIPAPKFDSRKVVALLLYLAYTQHEHSREVLAEMLWEERTQSQSLANLRVAISSLRQTVGPYVLITHDTLIMNPESKWWLDTAELVDQLGYAKTLTVVSEVAQIERTLQLYQGDFLAGFYVDSHRFEEWVLLERERFRLLVIEAIDTVIDFHTQQGNHAAGIEWASRLMQMDSLREKTHSHLMRLLAVSGQRHAALSQYETYCRMIKHELGAFPSGEMTQLFQQIRAGNFPEVIQRITPQTPSNLPVQSTSFVGRETECAELAEWLNDPNCRLITIIGSGGIGKTRLALEVARQVNTVFTDGVFFIPLRPVNSGDAILSAIVTALAVDVNAGKGDLLSQLLEILSKKSLLLVLDSVEHLLADLSPIESILSTTGQVKLLVTSRQSLDLSWEWQYELQGLSVPQSTEDLDFENFSSIRLFVERARRANRLFKLQDDPHGVIKICQLVEGMPLGIELAAAWVRVLSSYEIAHHIIELEAFYTPSETRHRSLQALFEQTWQLLPEAEQNVLMKLAVFQGGFTREAAEHVAHAVMPLLATLVNKSLLSMNFRTGRYQLHQLLREYMIDKLDQRKSEKTKVFERHTQYYADILQRCENLLKGNMVSTVVEELEPEIHNFRAVVTWALEQKRWEILAAIFPMLSVFYNLKGWNQESATICHQILQLLDTLSESPAKTNFEIAVQLHLSSVLTVSKGWGDPDVEAACSRVKDICQRAEEVTPQLIWALYFLITVYGYRGELQLSHELSQQVLPLIDEVQDPAAAAAIHFSAACMYHYRGEFALSLKHQDYILQWYSPQVHRIAAISHSGLDPGITSIAHTVCTLWVLGYPDQAKKRSQRAIDEAQALNHPFTLGFTLIFAACSFYVLLGDRDMVLKYIDPVSHLAQEHHFLTWLPVVGYLNGYMLLYGGLVEEGIAKMQQAITLRRSAGTLNYLPVMLVVFAEALQQTGHVKQGLAVVEEALDLIASTQERYCDAEAHRVKGCLLELQGDQTEAEIWLLQAIEIAQQQQAKSFELRATIHLCRLLQQQGRGEEARAHLYPLYHWFTEGLDTPDLVAARELLTKLV